MSRALVWCCVFAAASAWAASAIDAFDFADPQDAARYQRLVAEFRCPKCLNESLASSGAPIAADLRRTVRRLLEAGESDDAIRAYLRQRYGDFVLYDPPLRPATWLLWFSPLLLLAAVAFVLFRVARQRAAVASAEDLERARRLLERE